MAASVCLLVTEKARPAYTEEMTSPRSFVWSLLFPLVFIVPVGAQDTRGSLAPDTPVSLMAGTALVQDLDVGAEIAGIDPKGKLVSTKVTGIRRQHTDSYILLKAGDRELSATGSHRVALAGGKLVRLDTVKAGDKVWLLRGKNLIEAAVTSVRVYPANLVAYDLTVDGHLPFIAGDVVVGD